MSLYSDEVRGGTFSLAQICVPLDRPEKGVDSIRVLSEPRICERCLHTVTL